MSATILKNAIFINRGQRIEGDLLVINERIELVGGQISRKGAVREIDCTNRLVVPGAIDDQVHFREPGLTHKATIGSESRAAVAGGVTSFMEMPNTNPPATTQALLQDKYDIASLTSAANYSFFMGAANDNLEEVLKTDAAMVCGIKVFMGSSTGNMLVDNTETLEALFSRCPMLIATHCEDETTIREKMADFKGRYGDNIPAGKHPVIRNEAACYLSSSKAVALAKKYGTRLHVLHISTEEELALFDNSIPLSQKLITAEACVHHLWFSADDYDRLGNDIKCNPAIKAPRHRDAIWKALLDDRIDVIATDHAPHTREEKNQPYTNAPSGLPLVQHSLVMMLEAAQQGKISIERVIEKMAHAPAQLFNIKDRGYLDEGSFADLVVVNPNAPYVVSNEQMLYHCGWTPLAGTTLSNQVEQTYVNGHQVWQLGQGILPSPTGQRLQFNV
jgi:dihydroorotase